MDDRGYTRHWPTLHRQRLANVRRLFSDLKREGMSQRTIAAILGMTLEKLERVVDAQLMIDDAMAREIEWAVHRPRGWLDDEISM
ncbi:hypothetical protein [Luteibacter yeojuensis]|uniref:Helix-turn-helix protein n=1 Tax=Luteibacter yeojuensis TaxID=345309 RepID=A0A0F3KXE1_9GAMM|nr:hypothetical protein [Luteibacter yeojuensis]KJV34779.1 hypothetical protein VI08_09330 [Luteibacter yeojuensis]